MKLKTKLIFFICFFIIGMNYSEAVPVNFDRMEEVVESGSEAIEIEIEKYECAKCGIERDFYPTVSDIGKIYCGTCNYLQVHMSQGMTFVQCGDCDGYIVAINKNRFKCAKAGREDINVTYDVFFEHNTVCDACRSSGCDDCSGNYKHNIDQWVRAGDGRAIGLFCEHTLFVVVRDGSDGDSIVYKKIPTYKMTESGLVHCGGGDDYFGYIATYGDGTGPMCNYYDVHGASGEPVYPDGRMTRSPDGAWICSGEANCAGDTVDGQDVCNGTVDLTTLWCSTERECVWDTTYGKYRHIRNGDEFIICKTCGGSINEVAATCTLGSIVSDVTRTGEGWIHVNLSNTLEEQIEQTVRPTPTATSTPISTSIRTVGQLSAAKFFAAGQKNNKYNIIKTEIDQNLSPLKYIQSILILIGTVGAIIIILIYGIQWATATSARRQELKASLAPLSIGIILLVIGPRMVEPLYTMLVRDDKTDVEVINNAAGSIISVIQAIGYIVAICMILYIGIQWVTAGSAAKRQELKGRMINLTIGAILIAGGVTILDWIANIANRDMSGNYVENSSSTSTSSSSTSTSSSSTSNQESEMSYQIILNNGEENVGQFYLKYGDSFDGKLPTLEKEGYRFAGWKDRDGNQYINDSTMNKNGRLILYAKFERTVRYDGNGTTRLTTTGAMDDSIMVYGEEQNLRPNGYINAGYIFQGWSKNPNSTNEEYQENENIDNLMTESDIITVYAIWACAHGDYTSEVTKVATCEENGLETRTCAREGCNYSWTVNLYSTHDYERYYKQIGNKEHQLWRKCNLCDSEEEVSTVSEDHEYSSETGKCVCGKECEHSSKNSEVIGVQQVATCNQTVTYKYTCTSCEFEYTTTITEENHSWSRQTGTCTGCSKVCNHPSFDASYDCNVCGMPKK